MNTQHSTTTSQNPEVRRTFAATIHALVTEPRLWYIYILGISSGYPHIIIGTSLTLALQAAGFSRTTITMLGIVAAAYAFNFAWGPVVDHLKIPLLGRLGLRKSWLLVCLVVLMASTFAMMGCIIAINITHSTQYLGLLALSAVILAFASATQDIVVAAYRITVIRENEPHLVGIAASMEVAGWWTGFGFPGFVVLMTVGTIGWPMAYLEQAVFFVPIILFVLLILKEPPKSSLDTSSDQGISGVLHKVQGTSEPFRTVMILRLFGPIMILRLLGPLVEFVKRNGILLAIVLIIFLISFKLGEGFLGKTSSLFYREVGFSYQQIGINTKLIGTLVTVVSSFVAGVFLGRFKAVPTLVVGGLAMSVTNLMFTWMAVLGPNNTLYLWTAILDGMTAGFSSVAFVVFITYFTSRTHAATQYAAMSSIGTSGKHVVAAFSGLLIDSLGGNWALFFILTAVWIIPVLLILYVLTVLVNRREIKGVQVKTYQE